MNIDAASKVRNTKASIAAAVLLTACSSTGTLDMNIAGGNGSSVLASDASVANTARVGFLTDYPALKAAPGAGGMLCWRSPGVDWKIYDKVMIERIKIYLGADAANKPIDPSDLKALLDYFNGALVKDLQPYVQVVSAAGPGVLRVRIALTALVPTNSLDSLAGTAIPYGFVAEVGSGAATGRPAGSTPYMGQTGMQVQFRDGATGKVIAECADDEIGRKYAADLNQGTPKAAETWVNGYLDSFTSWSYAQDAFNKWAALLAQRLQQLKAS